MKKRNKIGYIAIITGLTIAISINIYNNYTGTIKAKSSYDETLVAGEDSETSIPFDKDYILDSSFSTHLPIVVLNTDGVQIPMNSEWSVELKRYKSIPGLEPYLDGDISIIDNGKINKLEDTPTSHTPFKIKRRGNSSMMYAKGQYMVKLVTESGEEKDLSLLGMGEDNEWILNGSMIDKSLMRNYLAYRIGSQIMPYTPDSKYCEVVVKENGKYKYEGIYLLCESIKQGANRVNIDNYSESKPYSSYLLRRDRFDDENIMLDTYENQNKLSEEYLGLIYPSKNKISDKTVKYIENDINQVEKILYSDSYKTFSTYSNYIDVDSFIDYFLVNEFFGSYDAGHYSTYMYKNVKGKLTMGPLWDFDGTMDNFDKSPLETDKVAFIDSPWFKELKKDPKFIDMAANRYAELRRNQLSDDNISKTIDEIQGYLGVAQQREWTRWSNEYLGKERLKPYIDDKGDTIRRETKEYEQEIYKLKTVLLKHGQSIAEELPKYKKKDIVKVEDTNIKNNLLVLLFLVVFFTATIFARRR